MFSEIIEIDKICRLCLNSDGVMSKIHDIDTASQSHFSLCEKIFTLASLQILPDDGLPAIICHICVDKIEEFILFKEQIEHSHNVLCQCIEATTNKNVGIEHLHASKMIQPLPLVAAKYKGGVLKKPAFHTTPLIKDHLVSGMPEPDSDALVTPDFNFINISNLNYIHVATTSANNYSSMAIPNESICMENTPNILSKDLPMVGHTESNDDSILLYSKGIQHGDDTAKVFSITFADTNSDDNLQDIFPCLDNNESVSCQDGFEDISKYLKNSHGLDIKKLKEDFKNKETCLDLDEEILKKKLLNSGISLIKSSSAEIESERNGNVCTERESSQMWSSEGMSQFGVKSEKGKANVNEIPDMIFAKMSTVEKDKFIVSDDQEEVVARIVRVTHLDTASPHSQLKFTTYLCHLCLAEFRECPLSVLKSHADSHFAVKKMKGSCQSRPVYTCEACLERFTTRCAFINHQRKKLNLKIFGCENCSKRFWSKERLNNHGRVHSSAVTCFPCVFCGEQFSKKCQLQSHELTHTRDSPLICQHCNKECPNVVALKSHLKRHVEGMKYCCEVCGKRFYLMSQLKRHEQGHSGVRKFPCHICPKAFCSNSERRRHLLYHFKTKRFQCSQCDKKFYEAGHLKIHMRAHTNHRPFVCDVCGSSFHTRYKLKRHLANHYRGAREEKPGKTSTKRKLDTVVEPKFIKLCTIPPSTTDSHSELEYISLPVDSALVDGESYIIVRGDQEDGDSLDSFMGNVSECFNHLSQSEDDKGENKCLSIGMESSLYPNERGTETNVPDTIFAKMSASERDLYTHIDAQEEVVPRIVRITHVNTELAKSHLKYSTFLCQLCLSEYRECSLEVLESHSNLHFGERNIKAICQNSPVFHCEDCLQKFTSRRVFIDHQRNKLDINAFDCDMCNGSFCSKDKYDMHLCFQSNEDGGQTFVNEDGMHTSGKAQHCCKVCGKKFLAASQLERHEKCCETSQMGPCPSEIISQKTEQQNDSSNSNGRTDGDQVRFICHVCGKWFNSRPNLSKHLMSHTNSNSGSAVEPQLENLSHYDVHQLMSNLAVENPLTDDQSYIIVQEDTEQDTDEMVDDDFVQVYSVDDSGNLDDKHIYFILEDGELDK